MSDAVRLLPVIETKLLRRGDGSSETDPVRIVTQYWSLDGELLAEHDPWRPSPGMPTEPRLQPMPR